jgi:hypothetical protein
MFWRFKEIAGEVQKLVEISRSKLRPIDLDDDSHPNSQHPAEPENMIPTG